MKSTVSAQLHCLGSIAMALGALVLLPLAARAGWADLVACALFLLTGLNVFVSSSTYHFLCDGCEVSPRLRQILRNLDHFSIYLFIAGTYTPVLLRVIAEPWKSRLIAAIWSLALIGILYTGFKPQLPRALQSRKLYTALFLVMGWVALLRLGEIVRNMSRAELGCLFGGGLAYSVGALIYALKRPRLFEGVFGFHELWHVMVLVGALLHFCLVVLLYR